MILSSWRLVKAKYADRALDGTGAQSYGGRWNSMGVAMVYTSSSAALAALEVLTHLPPLTAISFQLIEFRFEEQWVHELPLNSYPPQWNRTSPPSPQTQRLGDHWVRTGTSSILRVASVHLPLGDSYLFNPAHRDFGGIEIVSSKSYSFDRRLLESA